MSLSRPLYVDPNDASHAVVYLRTTGGGLAENDRIRQRIFLDSGAQATVTTQAATNVHRMNAGLATQWVSFILGEGAHLEYFPGHTTLYGGSRLVQLTDFDVPEESSFIAGEVTLAGRLARGEKHEFDALGLSVRVMRNQIPLLADSLVTVGAGAGCSPLLWGEFPVWGTLLALGSTPRGSLMELCHSVLEDSAHVIDEAAPVVWGVSTMVGNVGAVVRFASHSTIGVHRAMKLVHEAVRLELCGKPSFDLRKM
ncbi:urease accessory protein UreD [Corynebacterium auriscanis]|uniref:urease accessory protein UreD n=1 Tax=Corynebacterium auriscanis TaxID=99807 RepID=UPI0022484B1F|nr:urease accessory protein UreD [Corynebacterium auriscanis]MCX2162652.1 urease accessory protein UreD [Corynebacterium auriscanis]